MSVAIYKANIYASCNICREYMPVTIGVYVGVVPEGKDDIVSCETAPEQPTPSTFHVVRCDAVNF